MFVCAFVVRFATPHRQTHLHTHTHTNAKTFNENVEHAQCSVFIWLKKFAIENGIERHLANEERQSERHEANQMLQQN